jgi:hypothetical protein
MKKVLIFHQREFYKALVRLDLMRVDWLLPRAELCELSSKFEAAQCFGDCRMRGGGGKQKLASTR